MIISTKFIYNPFTLFTMVLFEILIHFECCKYAVNGFKNLNVSFLCSFYGKNTLTLDYFTKSKISILYASRFTTFTTFTTNYTCNRPENTYK